VAGLVQCSFAIAHADGAGPGVEADLRDRRLFGTGTNLNGRVRTRPDDRSAREGSSAEHAALRQTSTHGPAQTRDRDRRGQTMRTISWQVLVALTSRPRMISDGRRPAERDDPSMWIAGSPGDVLDINFGRPAWLFEKFPREQVFIAPAEAPRHGARRIDQVGTVSWLA
jgi:hypothetical protein